MLELQENIAKVRSATAKLRRKLVDDATAEYLSTLDPIRNPARGDFEAAEARAYAVLKQELLSTESIVLIDGEAGRASSRGLSVGGGFGQDRGDAKASARLDDHSVSLLALSFDGISQPVRIPGPVVTAETRTIPLALAGAVGAVAGMVILAPLLRLAFDMRDLGLVLGGPLGALLAVLVAHRLARVRFLTRVLPWLFLRPKSLRGAVRKEHERSVRAAIEQWVDWAVPMLTVLCLDRTGRPQPETDKDKTLRRVGKLIYTLHRTPAESLPVVAHELIQEAKNAGFENLEGPPAFVDAGREEQETIVWKPDLQSKYETFGHIAEGDQVVIERPAVVLGGEIVQRGLVRKVRDRT